MILRFFLIDNILKIFSFNDMLHICYKINYSNEKNPIEESLKKLIYLDLCYNFF